MLAILGDCCHHPGMRMLIGLQRAIAHACRGLMRAAAVILLCLGVGAGAPVSRSVAPEPIKHEAYIWQRVWTPQLVAAVRASQEIVQGWRILLAEVDRTGRWAAVSVPWSDVLMTRRPVTIVIRLEGRLDEAQLESLGDPIFERLGSAIAALAAAGPAGTPAAIEIDYDCPTARLAAYARFLRTLRARLTPAIALSITALPTWMGSADLDLVLAAVDTAVLQVHAVDDPRRGLFDGAEALRRTAIFARRTPRPFRVALPAYDVRVSWRPEGGAVRVESEMPLLGGLTEGVTLGASPRDVLHFIERLRRDMPENLVGVAWFRLPTDADNRAWSLPTWQAVVGGNLPSVLVRATLEPTAQAALWAVVLSNDGTVDAALPRQVRLASDCESADGANGFRLRRQPAHADDAMVLEAVSGGRLRPQARRMVGWARCPASGRKLDVVQ